MKRVFYLTNSSISVYHWQAGRILDSVVYPQNEQCLQQLFANIEAAADIDSIILVDVIEEEFVQETAPHVSGNDRKALLQRKLRGRFSQSAMTLSIVQEREKEGRRDDNILLAGLTRMDTLTQLLSCLQSCKVPLTGIYSIPIVSELIVRALKLETQHNLLISRHSDSMVRQSFFNHCHIKSSRLSSLPREAAGDRAGAITEEIKKSQRYLNRIKLLPHNRPLDVYLIDDRTDPSQALPVSYDPELARFHYLELNQLSSRLGLQNKIHGGQLALLFSHVACSSRCPHDYAQPNDKRYTYFKRANYALLTAAAVLVLFSLGDSISLLTDATEYSSKANIAQQQLDYLKIRRSKLVADSPKFPLRAQDITALVKLNGKLERSMQNPDTLFKKMGGHFALFPELKIDSFSWKPIKPANMPSNNSDQGETVHANRATRIEISGHLNKFNGDYLYAQRLVDRLIKSLKNDGYFSSVKAIELPVNTNPDTAVSGVSGETNKATRVKFSIQLVTGEKPDDS